MRKQGEITVFLSLTLVCILSLCMGLLESARTAGARLYLSMAANSAMASVMSQYNRNLWDMYRLLYLEYESEGAIERSFEEYLNFYLEQENFYPMKLEETEITKLVTMTEDGGKALEDGILSYVKYRLPDIAADLSGLAEDVAEASKVGDFRTLFKVCREAGKKTRKLEKARRNLETALTDMEKLKEKAEDAAARERKGKFEDNGKKLLKKLRNFSGLVDKYEEEILKISAHRSETGEQGSSEEMSGASGTNGAAAGGAAAMDSAAAGEMGLELAAYGNVEEAAREMLAQYREMEQVLDDSRESLEEALEILKDGNSDEGSDDDFSEEDSEGEEEIDWDSIQECMEAVEIPEGSKSGAVDREKSAALDRLEEVLDGNWLSLVLPEGAKVSGKRVSLKGSLAAGKSGAAERAAASGGDSWTAGLADQSGSVGEDRSLLEKFLVQEYIFLYFDSFLGPCKDRKPLENQVLLYEQEYLLCGKSSDKENLEGTVERLLMLRGAMNLLYLINDAGKKSQADELALAVSGGNAPVQFILSFFILTLWALGEAIWDVRCLMEGGKVSFWKNEGTWKLGLEGLLALDFLNGKAESNTSGSDYKDYLRILFFLENRQLKNYRMMDVIQWNVRKKQSDFAAADCAYQIEIKTEVMQKHLFLLKNEYKGTVDTAWSY